MSNLPHTTADTLQNETFSARAAAHRRMLDAQTPRLSEATIEVSALCEDGSVMTTQRRVPMTALFETTFAAFGQGTLLQSETGQVAIEDLRPGENLRTSDGRLAKVVWIGSSTQPSGPQDARRPLVRVMADSFGVNRPSGYLTLGPAARMLQTPHHLRGTQTQLPLLTPISEFVDGVNVIEVTPPSPVQLFHICLDRHAILNAGGLELESFHPDPNLTKNLSQTHRDLFLSLFPSAEHMSDFGPASHLRLPGHGTDLNAA